MLNVKTGADRTISFRQTFGGVPAAQDGLVTMAIVGGKLVYLSSSLAGNQGSLPAPTQTPQAGFRAAAGSLGGRVAAADVRAAGKRGDWSFRSRASRASSRPGCARCRRRRASGRSRRPWSWTASTPPTRWRFASWSTRRAGRSWSVRT
jgi:hypothetical protein